MTDIFISYSRTDKAMVSKLAAALEAQGYVVWWDHSLHGGQSFAREIHKQIDQAKCAIVVWSQASVESDWVYSEASHASNRGILLTTVYQDAAIPLPYNTRHNEDLRGWNGEANTAQFQKLLSAVEKYCPISSVQSIPEAMVTDEQPAFANSKPRKINYLALVLGVLVFGAGSLLIQKSDDSAFWSGLSGEKKSQFDVPKAEASKQIEQPVAAAPVVSETPKPKTYALEVSTRPQNATVTVDGKPYDPAAKWLPGLYAITVKAEGYKPLEDYAAFVHDRDVHTTLTLKPLRYALTVAATPDNARITLPDSGKAYKPGVLLESGTYKVQVTARGYEPQERTVLLDNDLVMRIQLKRALYVAAPKQSSKHLSFEPEMVRIPAGTFTMGCVEGRDDVMSGCDDDEKPAHEVTISKDFFIGKYEVTFDEWDACTEDGVCPKVGDQGWGRGKRPVINVSWDDTQKYIGWLNKKTGKQCRLPTEAEWEYAARANAKTTFPWGNHISCRDANYGGWNKVCGLVQTQEVASYSANQFGLFDTVGNVWEWTQDWKDKYGLSAVRDPQGATVGSKRVLRGGSWFSNCKYCRLTNRDESFPSRRINVYGFRLACDD